MVFKDHPPENRPRTARALICIVSVPLVAGAKIFRIQCDLFGRKLKVVAFPRDGLDQPRGVKAITAEPAGRLRAEPYPRFAEFDRLRPTRPQWLRRLIIFCPGHPRRLDAGAGTDRVERDIVGPGLERQRLDKPFHPVLDGAVRDLLFVAADARPAGDADDVASTLRFHLLPRGVCAIEQPADADSKLPCPFFRRRRLKCNQRHVDRVVDYHVQPPPAVNNLLHHALALGEVGNIGAEGLKACTVGGEVTAATREFVITNVRHAHPRARDAKRPCDSPSQTPGRAGDEGNAVLVELHRELLSHRGSSAFCGQPARSVLRARTAPGPYLASRCRLSGRPCPLLRCAPRRPGRRRPPARSWATPPRPWTQSPPPAGGIAQGARGRRHRRSYSQTRDGYGRTR